MPHFLQRCTALDVCRKRLAMVLGNRLPHLGNAGALLMSQFDAGGLDQLRLLLDTGRVVSPAACDEVAAEQFGQARWVVDKAAKNFLCACWKLRRAILGEVRVERGRLMHEPVHVPVAGLTQRESARSALTRADLEFRQFWSAWMPGKAAGDRRRRRGRAHLPFFAVWKGRQTGVFCGWEDCVSRVANFPGARFKGFRTLEEAEHGFALGPDPHAAES